jgi:ferrous iron transport protein B
MKSHQSVDTSGLAQKRLALLGNPNCGKSVLFNRLTGSRQKVANYAGVTVELKRGLAHTLAGRAITVVDLPGTYSLEAGSDDEAVACAVVTGQSLQERAPDLVAVVLDAGRLRRGLRLVAGLQRLGVPMVVVLNMVDRLGAQDERPDTVRLSTVLGVPVVQATGIRAGGADDLLAALDDPQLWQRVTTPSTPTVADAHADDAQAQRWLQEAGLDGAQRTHAWSYRLDAWLLHPLMGSVVLLVVLFMIFQAVFSWAAWPMDMIDQGVGALGQGLTAWLPEGLVRSLLIDGVLAGLGGVVVFLPQILILFFFILVLEESGYLPRAALLLDRLMGSVGLSGRSFIPLLSSFACAIPGVMASRTIADKRDRWVTIMIAPLMTCSARLPVYALLIGAFIPNTSVWGLSLPGLVMFGLYLLGIVSAVLVAWVAKRFRLGAAQAQLMMELPDYHWPRPRDVLLGLWQRASIFLRNVGGIILALTIILWFLATFPQAPVDFAGAPIEYSLAGRLGQWLSHVFAPIGFNWQISVALIPGLAAREVAVSALGTVYALSSAGDDVGSALAPLIAADWSLPTALSLLIWYVYAPQCLATLAVVRKEVGGWRAPMVMAVYLFGLAYAASYVTYRVASAWST